jgi:hypothetical protein
MMTGKPINRESIPVNITWVSSFDAAIITSIPFLLISSAPANKKKK